jgi:broad specificity phosphatase PhoE
MGRAAVHLFLIRHGKTDWNEQGRLMGRNDVGLNQRGQAQAEAVGRALAGIRLDRVFASPQPRALETARAIAARRGSEVAVEPALAEVWVGDAWQGKTFAELSDDPHLRRYFNDPMYRCDLIEDTESIRDRVAQLAARLRDEAAGENVALVSHGDPLRILIAHLLGMPLENCRALTIDNGSLSAVRLGERARVLLLNWHAQPDVLSPGDATVI